MTQDFERKSLEEKRGIFEQYVELRGKPLPPKDSGRLGLRISEFGLNFLAPARVIAFFIACCAAARLQAQPGNGALTFNKHIAPIAFNQCSGCHREGQPAPFELLTYNDFKKRARQIVEVTEKRIMPPWLPDSRYVRFAGERHLSDADIAAIRQWANQGALEGEPADLPPRPQFPGGWGLGQPDLEVRMPDAFDLPAEGPDVYRNFVISIPLAQARHIRAVDLNPGNPRVVHHAFVRFDRTHESRREDAKDSQPGFPGMAGQAEMPDGHFLTWQPGKTPDPGSDDLAWKLDPGTDLVLELHLRPSGKAETVRPSVAFYFARQPPVKKLFKLGLVSLALDIPPGAASHVVENSFVLPMDASLNAVLPHAHFLARKMESWATLPDGRVAPLLRIDNWDFNWQGDYRYERPLALPKGTTLWMRYSYDNSTNNLANPFNPPRRVRYGPQGTDEMAELWFQFVAPIGEDFAPLARAREGKMAQAFVERVEKRLRENPQDAEAHHEYGFLLMRANRLDEAMKHFQTATRLNPAFDQPHYFLGLVHRRKNDLQAAEGEFQAALRLNPKNAKAHGNLGFIYLEKKSFELAERHLSAALELNPDDQIARDALAEVIAARNARP